MYRIYLLEGRKGSGEVIETGHTSFEGWKWGKLNCISRKSNLKSFIAKPSECSFFIERKQTAVILGKHICLRALFNICKVERKDIMFSNVPSGRCMLQYCCYRYSTDAGQFPEFLLEKSTTEPLRKWCVLFGARYICRVWQPHMVMCLSCTLLCRSCIRYQSRQENSVNLFDPCCRGKNWKYPI